MELPLGADVWGRQLHLVVDGGEVFRGHADLDHLESGRRLEHPVADLGGLDHAVAGAEHERRPLVLVHEPHPAAVAEDELEADRVVVDHVVHRTRFGDPDVRRDDGAAEPLREEVPVVHAGAADDPRIGVREPPHHETVGRLRDDERRIRVLHRDPVAAGGGQFALSSRERGRIVHVEPQRYRSGLGAPREEDCRAVSGERREGWRVGRPDPVEAEPERVHEEPHVGVEVGRGKPDLGAADQVRTGHGGGIVRHRSRAAEAIAVSPEGLSSCVRALPFRAHGPGEPST